MVAPYINEGIWHLADW